MLYCTWFATNSQRDLGTTNTVIIYIFKYEIEYSLNKIKTLDSDFHVVECIQHNICI